MGTSLDRLDPILNDTKLQSTNNALYQFLKELLKSVRSLINSSSSSSSNSGISGAIQSKQIILNNDQIKALPTQFIKLISAPIPGSWIRVVGYTFSIDTSAGAYTNINATYADLAMNINGEPVGYGPVNDSSVAPALIIITSLFGSATQSIYSQDFGNAAAWTPNPGYVLNNIINTFAVGGIELHLTMNNNGNGNLTGGNAANLMKITVYYSIEKL